MRSKRTLTALAALGASALLAAPALASTAASPGQLVGQPHRFDGQEVTVTGWVQVRGNVGWLQLCDDANSCVYLRPTDDYHGAPLRSLVNQRLTFAGTFHSLGVVNHTDVQDVLDVHG